MLLSNDKASVNKAHKWLIHSRKNIAWYQYEELGYLYRMSNIITDVVRGQIPYMGEHIAQKK